MLEPTGRTGRGVITAGLWNFDMKSISSGTSAAMFKSMPLSALEFSAPLHGDVGSRGLAGMEGGELRGRKGRAMEFAIVETGLSTPHLSGSIGIWGNPFGL